MDKFDRRPSIEERALVTTPAAAIFIKLLGVGVTCGPVVFSKAQHQSLARLYGFTQEQPNKKPPPPEEPKREDFDVEYKYQDAVRQHKLAMERHAKWEDPRPLYQAGADRNMLRNAEADGLRMIGFMAKFCETGEDPVKALVRMAIDAGYDVDPEDVSWAEEEDDTPARDPDCPPMKDAVAQVMGESVMSAADVVTALKDKNWLPNTERPKDYVAYLLSSNPKLFERVERGKYRVLGVRKAG